MSKKRVSGHRSKARRDATKPGLQTDLADRRRESALKRHRFIGIALSGGKADKSSLAVIEYYPEQGKVFLSRMVDRVKNEEDLSADLQIHYLIREFSDELESLAFNTALSLPKCLRCSLPCPGYENCHEAEIKWLWQRYREIKARRRQQKLFTPYTERCSEVHIATQLEEPFHPSHALGANMAPLFARGHFIARRLPYEKIEVFPPLSLWRVGRSLGISAQYLRSHKHSLKGERARSHIMKSLVEREIAFFYEQDHRLILESAPAFEAFLCALTGVLKFRGQCEARPRDFPAEESWIEIPLQKIDWGG